MRGLRARAKPMLLASMAACVLLQTSSPALAEEAGGPRTLLTIPPLVSNPRPIDFRKGEIGGAVMFLSGVATVGLGLVLGGIVLAKENDRRGPDADLGGNPAGGLVGASVVLLVAGAGLIVGGVLLSTRSD